MSHSLSACGVYNAAQLIQSCRRDRKVCLHQNTWNRTMNGHTKALSRLFVEIQKFPVTSHRSNLLLGAIGIYREVEKLKQTDSFLSEEEIERILSLTISLMLGEKKHPKGYDGYIRDINEYQRIRKSIYSHSMGSRLGECMLWILGVAILSVSVIAMAVSMKLMIAGEALNFLLTIPVLTQMFSGIGMLVGVSCISNSSVTLFNSFTENPIKSEMQLIENGLRHYTHKN
jgi:hypothetical protein